MSDAGQYKCIADYGGLGEHISQPATLTVYGGLLTTTREGVSSAGIFSPFLLK